jgi:3-oxoacyl-[acyl-carrier protein] reductase
MSKLSGKAALVTGGSRGIGAAIAKRLASDGAAVAVTCSASLKQADEVARSIQSAGGRAIALRADAADPAAVTAAVATAAERLGGLDIVVNNAGVLATGEIEQFPEDQFERMLAVNVRSAFYLVREASRHLRDNGRVVLIGSVNSDAVPFPGGSVYALTKGAVAAFTRGLARDLGPRGITVNNVQPGPIDTEMNPADGPSAAGLKGFMALKRFGRADEIAGLVAFLAGPEGAFITGAGLKIDGGFDA